MPFKFNPLTHKLDLVETGGGPGGNISTLTGDSGGPVGPDASHNVNIVGNPDIQVSGNALTNTLQLTDLVKLSPFVVDLIPGTAPYNTIQSALDDAYAAFLATGNPQSVYARPGTYTENLTFYNNVTLLGAMGQTDSHVFTIVGEHTLPASGQFCIYGAWLTGTTRCFSGPLGGTAQINLFNVIHQITGVGYTFDIDGYSGQVNLFDTLQFDGGTNGFIYNPTGNARVFMISGGVGLGPTPATAIISGDINLINNIYFGINLTFTANSNTQFNLSNAFNGTITLQDNAVMDINDSYHLTGALPAFVHNSTGLLTVSDVAINSSNVTPIQGSGTIKMGSITWLDGHGISPTITRNTGTALESGVGYFDNVSFDRGLTTLGTNGQVWIGRTGLNPIPATLTAGTGISISNGSGSITINATSGSFGWTDVTGATQTLAVQNGYVTDRGGGVTYTLPASGTLGDIIKIVGKLGLATVAQNANQQILIGSSSSTVGVGGSIAATNVGDCIELVCITAGASTVWRADSSIGNWTVV